MTAEFWAALAGLWLGTGTHFDGDLKPSGARYAIMMRVTVTGDRIRQEEIRFYGDSEIARTGSAGLARPGEGLEVVTILEAKLDPATATARFAPDDTVTPAGSRSAVRDQPTPATGIPRYRTWLTLPDPRQLVTTMYGFWSTKEAVDYMGKPLLDPAGRTQPNPKLGQVRGVSIVHYRRIAGESWAAARARMRQTYRIGATIAPGSPQPRRVEDGGD